MRLTDFALTSGVGPQRKGAIDDGGLSRVDGDLAGEAVAPGGERFGAQALLIMEVREARVDRRDACGGRGDERQVARQAIGAGVSAGWVAVRFGADIVAQLFGAPGDG